MFILTMMQGIHYCIITKNNVYYSTPNAMPSPSAVHMTLVHLRNKIFRDITVSQKGLPKYNLSKKCLHLLAHSPNQHQGRNGRENERKAAEAPDAQKSSDSEADVYAQESHNESEKEKEDKSPLHPKKKHHQEISLCSEKFSSQKELNDHIVAYHNYKFLCSDR